MALQNINMSESLIVRNPWGQSQSQTTETVMKLNDLNNEGNLVRASGYCQYFLSFYLRKYIIYQTSPAGSSIQSNLDI